jgi:DNA-binding NtrC family response regulator
MTIHEYNSGMREVSWSGPEPSAELLRDLARAGCRVGSGALRVVATRRGDRPPHPPAGAGAWVWAAARGPIAPAAAEAAALRGALDCLALDADEAAARIERRAAELEAPELEPPPSPSVIAVSEAGRAVLRQLARAARTSQAVLITGETGTGKEVASRLIHEWSERRERAFVPVNCASIPNELMEAELFGYARGAFSGAVKEYEGRIAAAEGGTVFLDEIDDTPPSLQVKLLRVLEDRVVSRLGENVWRTVDFRLVAATNRDLRPLVAEGKFGADLFERLAIVAIRLPPLRERAADIPALARYFVSRFAAEERRAEPVREITPEAMAALLRHDWPGNVRELRNAIYSALVDKRAGTELLLSDLPRRILARERGREPAPWAESAAHAVVSGATTLRDAVTELERAALAAALARAEGNAAEAARLLGAVGRGAAKDPGGTVRAMMRRLGRTQQG